MAPIENQLAEILLALENGKVTDEMLHSVGLSSVGELQAAVRNRSQEMLKTLRKKKRNKTIELVNKIAALQEGRFDDIDATFLMAIIKKNPSLQVLVCEAFKANSFQVLNDIRARFPKRVFSYFCFRKDFSGWPKDRALWEEYINRLINDGTYELIYTFDQHRFSVFVGQVDALLRFHDDFELDKAVRGRQLHLYLENLPRIMAESKNQDLIAQLSEKRDSMCGIDTRRLKHGGYRDQAYEKKRNLLKELIGLYREQGWVYGYLSSSVIGVDSVIYFELPDMEQISFHTRMRELGGGIPPYPKPWNGKENYTLIAIEEAIMSRYGDAISALK